MKKYLFTAWIGCCLLPILEKLERVLALVKASKTGDLPANFEESALDLFVVDSTTIVKHLPGNGDSYLFRYHPGMKCSANVTKVQ